MSLQGAARPVSYWNTTQFLSMLDLTPGEIETCLDLAASMKAARHDCPHLYFAGTMEGLWDSRRRQARL